MLNRVARIAIITVALVCCGAISAWAFDLPEYKTSQLTSGATVHSVQSTELPMIHFRLTFNVGTNHEAVGAEGTIDILKDWMDDGTTSHNRQALAEKLNSLGIQLTNDTSFETTTFTMNTLSKYQSEALELWLQYLFSPKFDEQHYTDIRSRVADNARMSLADGDTLVRGNFYNIMFGQGSYRTSEPTNPAAIEKITSDQVKEFYTQYFGLTNARFTIVGDFNESQLFSQLNYIASSLGRANKKAPEMNNRLSPEPIPGVYLIDRPLNQGYIRIGHRAVNRKDADFYAFQLGNEVLGGGSNSALYNRIRNKEGLAYSVFSATPAWEKSGVWYMSFATKLDKVPFGINAAIETVSEMLKKGMTPAGFNLAQNSYVKSMPFRLQTLENTASFIEMYEELGIGQKGFSIDEARYKGITQAQAESVLRKYLDPSKFVIVVAGPKDKLMAPLEKIGKVTLVN